MAKVHAGGHRYYLEAAGTPERPGIEAPGQWLGAGAGVLALGGVVEAADLEAVLGGADPSTGRPLAPRPPVTVAGFDLTFCAPKSVSLLHALGDDDVAAAVGRGHDRAVTAAMDYVERRALAVRRREEGLRIPQPAQGVAAAAFRHRVSRALDPHLHTHVVVANSGRGPAGDWSALDGRGVYAHATAAGALYHSQLRHELTRALGVGWEPLRNGRADIAGIGPDARQAFSRRSQEIAAHLEERGIGASAREPSRRALDVASLVTRAERDLGQGADELRAGWRARAHAVGLSPGRLDAVLDRTPGRTIPDGDATAPLDELIASVVRARPCGFARRHAVQVVASASPLGSPASAVERDADRLIARGAPLDPQRSADRVGVAEPSHELLEHARRRELEQLLERRGMTLEAGPSRSLGHERGAELGLGL